MNDYQIGRKDFKRISKGYISLLCILFFLAGCARSIKLIKSDIPSIQSVSIGESVKKPDEMYYYGARENALFAIIGGCCGGITAFSAAKKSAAKFEAVMESENIDVRQIVREQFVNELKDANLFSSIVSEGGNAEFKLSISGYGFAIPHGLTRRLKPQIGVVGKLIKSDGSIIWKKNEHVSPLSENTPSHRHKEYLSNPELIREALTIASQIAIGKLINDMKGE